ncbi:MAG TPA: hypothetical protein VIF34_08925 [Methylocystis sp.]|jgi:hypothetical protein
MTKTHSAAKTPQEIRAGTERLINQHRASVQGWLSAHHPGVLAGSDRNLKTAPTVEGLGTEAQKPRN